MTDVGLAGRVTLIIPTWNGGERFATVLDAWRRQQQVGELDILCPDSGSRDGTVDVIRRAGARLLPIPAGEFNHGDTRNRAVARTQREFIIFSVQDALPASDDVAVELLRPLLHDTGLAATYGRQVPLTGCHPVLAERIGAWAGGDEPVVQSLAGRRWDDLSPRERLGLVRYDHVIAAMRRAVWEELRIEPLSFGEDVGWASRVIRNGGRIAFVPTSVVEHSHDRSAWDEARRIYCDHRNLKRLVGLTTVPTRQLIRENVMAARAHYRQLIQRHGDVDDATRERWTEWADRLALYENWAQYLGANLSSRWWFRPIDNWLRRGI